MQTIDVGLKSVAPIFELTNAIARQFQAMFQFLDCVREPAYLDANLAQSRVDLGKLHRIKLKESTAGEKGALLFTKNCEQNAPYRRFYSQVISWGRCPGTLLIQPPRFVSGREAQGATAFSGWRGTSGALLRATEGAPD